MTTNTEAAVSRQPKEVYQKEALQFLNGKRNSNLVQRIMSFVCSFLPTAWLFRAGIRGLGNLDRSVHIANSRSIPLYRQLLLIFFPCFLKKITISSESNFPERVNRLLREQGRLQQKSAWMPSPQRDKQGSRGDSSLSSATVKPGPKKNPQSQVSSTHKESRGEQSSVVPSSSSTLPSTNTKASSNSNPSAATRVNTQRSLLEHAPRGIDNTGNSCYANSLFQAFAALYHEAINYIPAPEGQEEALAHLKKIFHAIYDRTQCDICIEDFIRHLMKMAFPGRLYYQQDIQEFHALISEKYFSYLGVQYTEMFFSDSVKEEEVQEYERRRGAIKGNLPEKTPKIVGPSSLFLTSLHSDHHEYSLQELVNYPFIGFDNSWPTLEEKNIVYPTVLPLFIPRTQQLDNKDPKTSFKRQDQVTISESVRVYNRMYELRCMIFHRGERPSGGHYIAAVKKGEQWYLVNDLDVTPVPFTYLQQNFFKENIVFAGFVPTTKRIEEETS